MLNPDLVSFERSDWSCPPYLTDVIREFAEHFKKKRHYFQNICRLIQQSREWKMNNLKSELEDWKRAMSPIRDSGVIIRLVEKAFSRCKNDYDIRHLRGGIVEALVVGRYGGLSVLNDKKHGWGAKVFLKIPGKKLPKEVAYICEKYPIPKGCDDRHSVDYGIWDGKLGKFYECKIQPERIECKEIMYMKKLKEELTQLGIVHEILFFCPTTTRSIERKLKGDGVHDLFTAVGSEKLEKQFPL